MGNNTGNFIELDERIEKIITLIMSDSDLCKLVKHTSETPLQESDFEVSNLIYDNVNPYDFIPDINTDTNTYINVYFDEFGGNGKIQLTDGLLIISVFSHQQIQKIFLDADKMSAKNRVNQLVYHIQKALNKNTELGIGKLNFYKMRKYRPNNNFTGYILIYKITEFQ